MRELHVFNIQINTLIIQFLIQRKERERKRERERGGDRRERGGSKACHYTYQCSTSV